MKTYLDYVDIIYDQPNNKRFTQKIEQIQYHAALAITGAIKGTSQNKLYGDLEFESLKLRRWFRKLCTFFKIKATSNSEYLFDIIPKNQPFIQYSLVGRCYNILQKNGFFQVLLFPSAILELNKIDRRIRHSTTSLSFKNALLEIGRPTPKRVYNIVDPNSLKLLTRLRLGLSHLNEHKFNHNFKECVNPLCPCSLQVESVSQFFHYFTDIG